MKIIHLTQTLILLSLTLLLASCSTGSALSYEPRQIAEIIIHDQYPKDIPALNPLLPDDDYYAQYLSGIYQLDTNWVKDGAIFYSDGMKANEFAVFLLSASADSGQVEATLKSYISQRAAAFGGYAPQEAAMLENGSVITNGDYAALLVCQDPKAAKEAFLACFSDNPPSLTEPIVVQDEASSSVPVEGQPDTGGGISTPAGAIETASPGAGSLSQPPDTSKAETAAKPPADSYDPAAVLSAYRSGQDSALTAKNAQILKSCRQVIAKVIKDNMSDYQKELAIHDWIVNSSAYDEEASSNAPDAKPDPNNDNPYGLLVNGKAICSGFTSTFQLFMDMLEIECISVQGSAYGQDDPHAWNMVKLDGAWYCVDVTWDETGGYTYFNVSSAFMRETEHEWDESTVPEAAAAYRP